MKKLWPIHLAVLLVFCAFVAACNNADTPRQADRLIGTWLEESEDGRRKMKLVVTLEKGGSFQQAVKVVKPDGSIDGEVAAGDWFFDGETFKRRYRTVNGKRVSGIQFASYEVTSLTETELICTDHLREGKRTVRFFRVPEGTLP